MKDLLDAEIFVRTTFSMETGSVPGAWFSLSDYATIHEFQVDCAAYFDETEPEYRYTDWSGVPDFLISHKWLCPNIFEIRDAIQMLDGDSIDDFSVWCRTNGHDITTEDSLMLVTRFQDHAGPAGLMGPLYEPEISDADDCACAIAFHSLMELGLTPVEIFDDNDYG